jgi:hypothetical protein
MTTKVAVWPTLAGAADLALATNCSSVMAGFSLAAAVFNITTVNRTAIAKYDIRYIFMALTSMMGN